MARVKSIKTLESERPLKKDHAGTASHGDIAGSASTNSTSSTTLSSGFANQNITGTVGKQDETSTNVAGSATVSFTMNETASLDTTDSVTSRGVVELIEKQEPSGYWRLIIRKIVPGCFDFSLLRFTVWNPKRLRIKRGGEMVVPGDMVVFRYQTIKRFKKLKKISIANQLVECKNCWALLASTQEKCVCDNNPDTDKKLNSKLKLIAKTEKEYLYSSGVSLTFVDDDQEVSMGLVACLNFKYYL